MIRVTFCPGQVDLTHFKNIQILHVLIMVYGTDQSNELSVLDSSRLTIQLEYFNHTHLDKTQSHIHLKIIGLTIIYIKFIND